MPFMPSTHHVMTNSLDAHPLRIESALASALDLGTGLIRVGDAVRGAMNGEQSGACRDEIAVAVLPPRRKRYHRADATAGGQVRGDAATHRMTYDGNVVRLAPTLHVLENPFGVAQRIHARTIPSAEPVLHLPHVHCGTQAAPQRTRNELHSHVRQLPPPGRLLAMHSAARQHQHTPARCGPRHHGRCGEPGTGYFCS
jgi:hypothetical protein